MMGGTQCSMAAGVGVGAGVHRAAAPVSVPVGPMVLGARGSGGAGGAVAGGCQCSREVPLLFRTFPAFCGALGVPAPQLCPLARALISQLSGSPSQRSWKTPSTFLPLGLGICSLLCLEPPPCAHPRLVWGTRILSGVSSPMSPCQEAPANSPDPIAVPVRNALLAPGPQGPKLLTSIPRKQVHPSVLVSCPCTPGQRGWGHIYPPPQVPQLTEEMGQEGPGHKHSSRNEEMGLGWARVAREWGPPDVR